MNTYDYIIVGAGSAGCVLADRLTASGRNSVLLIEAGPVDSSFLINMPRGIGMLYGEKSPFVYHYEARKGGNRGVEPWVKGRGLGGSSSINGMVYARGHPQDFDDWAASGCTGWGWSEIGRAYKALEGHALGAGEWRGAGGPLKISMQTHRTVLSEALIKAGEEMGLPRVDDPNDAADGGIGYQPRTIQGGRRMSAARAFLKPAMKRPNLTVLVNTQVLQVLFDGRKAVRLKLKDAGGALSEVGIGGEVILSAGALETPKLLQLSGVGPASHLQALGVPVVADLPNVGRNLHDHINFAMQYDVNAGSYSAGFRGLGLLLSVARYQLFRSGPMTHAAYELMAFVKSRPELDRPDSQLGFMLLGIARKADGTIGITPTDGMMIHQYYARPTSQGYCQIQSPDPAASLLIDANWLDTENDRRHSIDTVRYTHRMMSQPALRPLAAAYSGPPVNFDSDDEIHAAITEFGSTAYHVCGTCRMGSDPEAVVDPQLRVRGVDGVRVLDTSVMPLTTTGNTNAPAMAMAWRGAEIILG